MDEYDIKINNYIAQENLAAAITKFLDAKIVGPYMEVCPYCIEPLWLEFGYWSYYEMLIWEQLYYTWDMPSISHYREVLP